MKEKYLITTYNGVKIFYHIGDAQLHATNEKTGENFQAKYIFEMEREIDNPIWEPLEEKGYIVSGYFGREITEVEGVRRDKKSGRKYYKRGTSTGSNYDRGKELSDKDETIFPQSTANKALFEEMEILEKKKSEVFNAQVRVANRLS